MASSWHLGGFRRLDRAGAIANRAERVQVNRWNDWWRQSQMEMQAAEHLLTAGDYAWCCFTCQQAAEKALKAVLEHRNEPHEGHSIHRLLQAVAGGNRPAAALTDACSRLNRLYIPTRYPDAVPEGAPVDQFTEGDARDAIADARAVHDYVAGLVGPPPP